MPSVPLTTIRAVKDQPVTYQPLMLARITFPTGGTPRDVSAATNASPIAITTSTAHGWSTGDRVTIYGVGGNLNANATWTITVTSSTTFTLDDSTGSGSYTSGGKVFKNDVLRLSTHGLSTADGGFQYGGQNWLPRILNQDVAATQALSEQGVDYAPSVTLRLADPDKFLWLNFGQSKGFKGATLEMVFSFWSVDTSTFSSDYLTKFVGVCNDATDGDEEGFSVTATNKMNMGDVQLPTLRVQKHCPWAFPATIAERQDGADMFDSPFYMCGYSPDASGSNARGNFESGSTPFTRCGKTKEDCVARGMYSTDGSARVTGRFGGVQWAPPQSFVARGFVSGKWEEVTNQSNEAKYGDFVPVIYGTQRADPLVLNVTGDVNLTKMEVLLCQGEIDYIYEVIVNDVRIPHVNDDTEFMSTVREGGNTTSGFWFTVNKGDRDGRPNPDSLYDSKGDPYGSLAVISIVVPKKLADSSSVPRVQVHLRGPKVRKYTSPGAFTLEYSENPAWTMLDLLTRANWRYSEIDVQSFIDAAAKCDVSINYANQFGATGSHPRYTCSMTIRQRRSAADVIRGLRTVFKANLTPNYGASGRLQLNMRETLASQQPSADLDSNFTTPISSVTVAGVTANGYVKWDFSEQHYLKRHGKSTFRVFSRQDRPPNRISAQFQNRDNRHATESVAIIDSEDVTRIGQEIPNTLAIDGVDNFDQFYRCVNTVLAEGYRGNTRLSNTGATIGDTGGTTMVEFETSFRVVHLRIGDIVRVSHQAWGIANQLFRVTKVKPSTNFETVSITASLHKDAWYLDTFGQTADPRWRPTWRNLLERPSYPWSANGTSHRTGDVWGATDENSFTLGQLTETLADGSALQKLEVTGALPVNVFPSEPEAPFCDQQGSTAPTGGDIPGGQSYFVVVCAKSATGTNFRLSAPSRVCVISVPAGTNTNTITVSGLVWGTGAAGYVVFAGSDVNTMTYQADGDSTPSSITLAHIAVRTWGSPDSEFDKLRFRVKRVLHAGVWGAGVVSCTSTTITVGVLAGTNAGFTTNQWVGYDLSLLGMNEAGDLPIANWTVTANTADTLTVTGPDPTTLPRPAGGTGLAANDIVVLRSKPTVGSDSTGNYVEDAGWINNLNSLQEPYSISNATNASGAVQITLSAATPWLTGDRVYVQGVGGVTAANGLWTVTRVDSTHFNLDGSTFSGTYTSGGTANRMETGFIDGQETGRILRIIHGPGKGSFVKVKSNLQVSGPKERIYIDGAWPVTPTSASRYIIEEAAWQEIKDSESYSNERYDAGASATIDVNNYKDQVLLVQVLTVDGGEYESVEYASPLREIYVFGGAGTIGFTGAIYLNVDDTLGIGSDLAPRVFLSKDARAVSARAEVKSAPIGSDLVIKLYVDAALFMTLTIPAGSTFVEASSLQLTAAPTITENASVKLDLTQVGVTFPGADLAVIIYV